MGARRLLKRLWLSLVLLLLLTLVRRDRTPRPPTWAGILELGDKSASTPRCPKCPHPPDLCLWEVE